MLPGLKYSRTGPAAAPARGVQNRLNFQRISVLFRVVNRPAPARPSRPGNDRPVQPRPQPTPGPLQPSLTVLFDGLCPLCDGLARWVIRHEPRGTVRFASRQSATAQRLLAEAAPGKTIPDSLLVVEHAAMPRLLVRSAAVLAVVARLTWPWRGLTVLRVFPRRVRDWAYDLVARRRVRWFGRRTSCAIPDPRWRGRMLE